MPADPIPDEENNPTSLFFEYNLWANISLFDACLSLTESQLGHADPGTYGSILETLTHLVRSEERYLFFLGGSETTQAGQPEPQPDMAELRQRVDQAGRALLQAARSMQPGAQARVGLKAERMPAAIVLIQTIYHSSEHRTHVATLLGQLGIQPPPLSGWDFYDEKFLGSKAG